ncbi:MAG TPA: transcription antitermination factor NusB [Caulobacterales bacterium]|nr:transcription antitermination factor NusB [Caulobacterales bacterium]
MTARRAAAELLVAVLNDGRALEDALDSTPSFAALTGRDRGFARAMAAAALRRLGGIDAVLAQFLERPLHESAAYARALLRVGAAQILVLGTPPHAAVGETVDAANATREGRPFARLINAVLRRISRDGPAMLAAQAPGTDLPAWLFTRWRAAYGAETADAIALALHAEPPLDLSVKADAQDWAARLGGDVTPTGNVRLPLLARGGVDGLAGYGEGAWWVQDAAAALPARLLGDVRARDVLDLCAAPGGKTLQLAAAGARVVAVDKSAERLERLAENLQRTKLSARVVCADVLDWRTDQRFDAILLDAPCTSTGTLRRHPDVAWLRRPGDVRALSELQARMLSAAGGLLKPDGALVYAVCSLEPEEGPGVVAQALGEAWRRDPVRAGELPDEFITADGDMRTLPGRWPERGGLDGFFAARLRPA